MQVILKEDVVNLGYKDDIVTVKDGYGRNFLIPTGKAVIASESAKKVLAENLKQRAHKLAKIKEDAQTLAAKLEGVASVSYTHLRAHETPEHLVCRLLLEKIFLMIRRPPRSTRVRSSAASDVYKRQDFFLSEDV